MFVEPHTQDESHFRPRAGLGCAIRAVATWATDAVLAGMVAAGLGVEALCFYLSLSRIELLERAAAIGLPHPHERRLRRSGRTGWTPEDVRQLAELWVLGVRASVIAEVLGRSVGAVYGQRRRLGLPARLRRGQTELPAMELADRKYDVRSAAHAHGQVWPRPSRRSRQLELPFAESHAGEIKPEWSVLEAKSTAAEERPKDPILVEAISRLDEMWRVGRCESRMALDQTEMVLELALRALAQQHPRAIAAAMGMTYSAVVNRVSRLGISKIHRRLVEDFDPARAFEFLDKHNLEPRTCKGLKRLFFAAKGAGSYFCPEWAKPSEVMKREGREAGVGRERSRTDSGRNVWVIRLAEERAQLSTEAKQNFLDQWDLFEKELNETLNAA